MGKTTHMKLKPQMNFKQLKPSPECFGGSLLKSNPKCKRPLSAKLPLHLVLRSSAKKMSMRAPKNYKRVTDIVYGVAKKYGVSIFEYGNAGNHIHLALRIPNRRVWAAFIRELSGKIAQMMQGLRGRDKGVKFWSSRPFTRIVKSWGKPFRVLKDYVLLNALEGAGYISRGGLVGLFDINGMSKLPLRWQQVLDNYLSKMKNRQQLRFSLVTL